MNEGKARALVIARSDGACEVCGAPGQSVHHRLKRSQGGTWDPANLLRLCGDGTRGCHGWIEAHPTAALLLGLWLPSGSDPQTAPAYINPRQWWPGWWLLDSEACFTPIPPEDAPDPGDALTVWPGPLPTK